VLDYSGDAAHTGKNLGDDLREGKPTCRDLRDAARLAEQAALVRSAIERGGRKNSGRSWMRFA